MIIQLKVIFCKYLTTSVILSISEVQGLAPDCIVAKLSGSLSWVFTWFCELLCYSVLLKSIKQANNPGWMSVSKGNCQQFTIYALWWHLISSFLKQQGKSKFVTGHPWKHHYLKDSRLLYSRPEDIEGALAQSLAGRFKENLHLVWPQSLQIALTRQSCWCSLSGGQGCKMSLYFTAFSGMK